MRTEEPKLIRLEDYRPHDYRIDKTRLEFDLDPKATRVTAELEIRANPAAKTHGDLELAGDELELVSVALDGRALGPGEYEASSQKLVIKSPPQKFTLKIETRISPEANTKLMGLYFVDGLFCTQCEPEGFRRMTYYIDRPDNLAVFSTRLIADKAAFPVLLSNGNEVGRGDLPGDKHFVDWEDPYPKPSYLFALAGGKLGVMEDSFTTASGRKVRLRIFVDPGNEPKVAFAMGALKRAMQWDEETFGLEYDLDDFMIVAIGAFNMGAMENKGLNVFNSALLLASPETATDADYERVEGVIGHEYFHNWTGDRVTCRDWFQLSLKEGLTVFRDQQFTADMRDAAVKRIDDVRLLKARQFVEDDGPLVHPPRPSSFIEIENFYTVTVYEKGAEISRMLHRLLGKDGFRKGMDLYIERNDGTAARIEDFIAAMADANGRDLSQFALWYSQAGRPTVKAETSYDEKARSFEIRLSQSTRATPGESTKQPFHIPVAVGLLDEAGKDIPLRLDGEPESAAATTRVLELKSGSESFRFVDVPKPQARSLLRGFSAPVTLEMEETPEETAFRMAYDSDSFNRWEAGQRYATRVLLAGGKAWRAGEPIPEDKRFLDAMARTASDQSLEPAFKALALSLPTVGELAQGSEPPVDHEALHEAREALRTSVGKHLGDSLKRIYEAEGRGLGAKIDAASAAKRTLRNTALGYLVAAEPSNIALAQAHYDNAETLTDQLAALQLLADSPTDAGTGALADFYARFKSDALVVDKWFRVQGLSKRTDTLQTVKSLMQHRDFTLKNPNRVRALIGAYTANLYRFYSDGPEAFAFLADQVLTLDKINPSIAARLLSAIEAWRRLPEPLQMAAKRELERIKATEGLSRNVFEIATKCLGDNA